MPILPHDNIVFTRKASRISNQPLTRNVGCNSNDDNLFTYLKVCTYMPWSRYNIQYQVLSKIYLHLRHAMYHIDLVAYFGWEDLFTRVKIGAIFLESAFFFLATLKTPNNNA